MLVCPRRGWPGMRCMARTLRCAPPAGAEVSDTCWRWRATITWSPLTAGSMSWQRPCPRSGGSGYPPEPARRAPRLYSWLLIDIPSTLPGCEWIMVRRNDSTRELAYFRCWSPHPVALRTLVGVAGRRWTIEESFQAAKRQAGLDAHQVRTWTSWRRWVILSMLAMAFLAVTCANERNNTPTQHGLIPFTLNEIRRLFDKLILARTATEDTIWDWPLWRRKHQATARYHHYRRRSEHQ